jgi:hypothetical protein
LGYFSPGEDCGSHCHSLILGTPTEIGGKKSMDGLAKHLHCK